MATKKGQTRKTARRAYMPRRKARRYHKPATQINVIPLAAGAYIAGDALFGNSTTWGSAYDRTKLNGYNPFVGNDSTDQTGFNTLIQQVKINAIPYAEVAAGGLIADYIGRKTSIGRRIALKTKKWNIKLF